MRVRLPDKSKPNNYTESCMINEADGWRGRNVWYLGRSVRYALKEVTTTQSSAKFLGFALGKNGRGIYVRVHTKSWKKFKSRLKELSSRKHCQSNQTLRKSRCM